MNTRALILDFGGVISRTLFETHDLSEKALGLPTGSLTWQGPFAPEATPSGAQCRLTKYRSATIGKAAPLKSPNS